MKLVVSKKILLPVILLAVAVAGAWLLHATKPKTLPLQVEEQAWVVATQPVKLETVAPTLPLYGRVETPRTAKLASALSAEVREVPVREGDAVRKGQILIRLDDRDSRLLLASREADVHEAQAAIDSAQRSHDNDVAALEHEKTLLGLNKKALQRAKDVAAKGLAAQSIVDDARQTVERQALAVATRRLAVRNFPAQLAQLRARLAKAVADRDTAALNVKRTRITAPFAGRVAKVSVAPGDRVNVGSALLEFYDTHALELRAQIPAPNVAAMRRVLAEGGEVRGGGRSDGQAVRVVLERLAGRVEQGSGGIDGLFKVTAGRDILALGQFVDLSVELAPLPGVTVLPATALYGMKRIYLLRDGRMAGVDVDVVGERRHGADSRILVRSPQLHDGDQVIITHLPNAIDGLRVKTAAAKP
jgi:multidrug efflux pump subunit AcrA (membrane-fusion protein)